MESRNYIMAIALSMVVLVGWQYFIIGPKLEQEQQRQEMEARMETSSAPQIGNAQQAENNNKSNQITTNAPQVDTGSPQLSQAQTNKALLEEKRLEIKTSHVSGSLNLRGARLDDIHLVEYKETLEEGSDTVTLLSPVTKRQAYFAEFGWTQGGGLKINLPHAQTLWNVEGNETLTAQTPVVLKWDNGEGLIFTRTLSIDHDYMISIEQTIQNTTNNALTLFPYGLVQRLGMPQTSGLYILHEGLVGFMGEEGLVEVDYDDILDEKRMDYRGLKNGWLGITDKYWATALIPDQARQYRGEFTARTSPKGQIFKAAFLSDGVTIEPQSSQSVKNMLFAGAKEVTVIDRYDEELNIDNFDLIIDWGLFYFITKPIFTALNYLHGIIGNFGLAILALTVVIKLFFLPLANKSYASMSRMKKVQPQMKEIQAKHKDDRMAMQKAMMELYKKEQINPISGCWPVIIQIPVFFALYKVLYITIEMRHAPFFGWIQDLSAPDPTSLFNLFGMIPWDPPLLLTVGIWPILMGVTMWIQMRLNPAPQDPTQAMIFNWMPLFFTFLLASFPAGLVIYWTWNNFLSILQQSAIMKRHNVPIELFSNMKGMFSRSKKEDDETKSSS